MSMTKLPLIGITGTTCVGKSKVAVELAKKLNTCVISADSMQIYKGMNIGTAKVTDSEMQDIKHYMLDIVEPCEDYSSFLFQQDAGKIIDALSTAPIICGGTGFYFDSLLYPPEFSTDDSVRMQVADIIENNGLEYACELLKQKDIDTYNKIDIKNKVRVSRALEIALCGEKQAVGQNHTKEAKYDMTLFVLQRDRNEVYEMADKRVDEMIENGLVDECKTLLEKYGRCKTSAFQAIGYKEIYDYLDGICALEDAIKQIKLNTRHYIKRQISYFKRLSVLEYVNIDDYKNIDDVVEHIFESNSKYVNGVKQS